MKADKERIVLCFGEVIRMARLKKHLSQQDVGEMIGVSHVHIGHMERGKREPSITMALRLCEALEVNINDVIKSIIEELEEINKAPQP